MTKHELVAEMSKELGITQKKCGETLNVLLEEIVRTDNKQRYSFNDDHTLIRANQGHSIKLLR